MHKSIRVQILDREYPLRVSDEREEQTRKIVEAVDARMQAIRKQLPTEPDLTVAVMAALAYGEELAVCQSGRESRAQSNLTHIESMLEALSSVVE
jgi:cell division protein ZapA